VADQVIEDDVSIRGSGDICDSGAQQLAGQAAELHGNVEAVVPAGCGLRRTRRVGRSHH
jgi:hypothetical protein